MINLTDVNRPAGGGYPLFGLCFRIDAGRLFVRMKLILHVGV